MMPRRLVALIWIVEAQEGGIFPLTNWSSELLFSSMKVWGTKLFHSEADSGSDSPYLHNYCLFVFFHGRGRVSPDSDWHCDAYLLIFLHCTFQRKYKGRGWCPLAQEVTKRHCVEKMSALVTLLTPQKLKQEEGGGFDILLYLSKLDLHCVAQATPLSHTSVGLCLPLTLSKSWLVSASVCLPLTLEGPF